MMARLAALAALFVLAAPATASGLIDNVNGITTDASGKVVRFNALLIDGQGRIERRLQGGDKRPKKLDFRFDGKGQTLVPGFVDARAEIMKFAVSLLSLDLSAAVSAEDTVQRVAAYMRGNGGRRWILGTGWDDARWPTGSAPSAADLDRIAPDVPVWLVDSDGERGWANSAALRLAGITAATPQPAGGRIILASGKPTGLLVGRAMDLVERIVPRPAPKDLDAAFLKAQAAFLARGITAVGDVGTDISLWQTYRRAGDRGALRLRITGYTASVDELPLVAGPAPTPWVYDSKLRLAGAALSIDGGLGARRAWLSAPYADLASESGAPLLNDTRLRNQMSRAAMDGFAIVLAAHGDSAVSEALSAIGEMGATYGAKGRWRIDGADVSAAALPGQGVTIAVPVHAIGDGGALARARLGARADTSAYGWASLVNNGTVIAFHGHAPFAPLDPLAAMRLVMTRENRADQRLNFGQALRAATAGGAAALGAEERFGALEPGQYADFVLLDRDIELSRPADIGGARVVETWMAGQKMILERGK
jgi:predicted amidohydrolase YtcJ